MHPKFCDSCVVAHYFWRQLRTRTLDLKTVAHLDTGFEDSCVFWTQGHIWAQALDSPNEKSNAPPPPEPPIRKKIRERTTFQSSNVAIVHTSQFPNAPHFPMFTILQFCNVDTFQSSNVAIFQCCNLPILQSSIASQLS